MPSVVRDISDKYDTSVPSIETKDVAATVDDAVNTAHGISVAADGRHGLDIYSTEDHLRAAAPGDEFTEVLRPGVQVHDFGGGYSGQALIDILLLVVGGAPDIVPLLGGHLLGFGADALNLLGDIESTDESHEQTVVLAAERDAVAIGGEDNEGVLILLERLHDESQGACFLGVVAVGDFPSSCPVRFEGAVLLEDHVLDEHLTRSEESVDDVFHIAP